MKQRWWVTGLAAVALSGCELFETVDPCMNGNCLPPPDAATSASPPPSATMSTLDTTDAGAPGTSAASGTTTDAPSAVTSAAATATGVATGDGAVSTTAVTDGGPPTACASNCDDGICHPVTHTCVACWADDTLEARATDPGCSTEAPHCLESDDAPAVCVACLRDDQCGGETPLCNTETHACVRCESNSDCPDPAAAHCDATGSCVPCDPADSETDGAHVACTHLAGADICHAGNCVQCDAAHAQACGNAVCTLTPGPEQFTCDTTRLKDSAAVCAPCVNDAECHPGAGCVPVVFDNGQESVPTGYHCLFRVDPDLTGSAEEIIDNRDEQGVRDCGDHALPYITQKYYTSLTSDEVAPFCQPGASTCLALNQYRTTPCGASSAEPGGVEECGVVGIDDAVCQTFTESKERCAPRCVGDEDCVILQGTTELRLSCGNNGTCNFN